MTFQIDQRPGKCIYPRIERRQRPKGAQRIGAIMHHAVRVAIGLIGKFCVGGHLRCGAIRCHAAGLRGAGDGSNG